MDTTNQNVTPLPSVNVPKVAEVKDALVQKAGEVKAKVGLPAKSHNLVVMGAVLVVILAGVGTGWLLSGKGSLGSGGGKVAPGAKQSAKEAGISDEATFKDSAEGILEEGGIAGEGTHHLVRDGGASQYVYLTSTAIDLSSFTGKKVKVWGQTITARKAGWLMDVGKIKVVD